MQPSPVRAPERPHFDNGRNGCGDPDDAHCVTAVSALRHAASRALDRWYHTDTSGKVHLPDVHDAERIYYIASPWRSLPRMLPKREVSDTDVFIDVGCGKGRVVLEAAAGYPFRRCMGVELVPEIYQQAVTNIRNAERRHRRIRGRVELVNQDMRDFVFPDDVSVVYAFNPFRGSVWEAAMNALVASYDRVPRRIRLVYAKPLEADVLSRMGRFEIEREIPGTIIYRVR